MISDCLWMFEISKCKIAWLKIDQIFYVQCSVFLHPKFLILSFPALSVIGLIELDKTNGDILVFYNLILFSWDFRSYFFPLAFGVSCNFIFAIKMNYNFINKYVLTKTTCNGIHLPKLLDEFLYSLHIILRILLVIQEKVYSYCLMPVWLKLGSLKYCYEKWLCF